MEKTNTTMYISFLMNIINVVGNFVDIFILHVGVIGKENFLESLFHQKTLISIIFWIL